MKHMILMSIFAVAACGGDNKKDVAKPKVIEDDTPVVAKPAPPPEPPPPPKSWRAQAALTPLKGVKFKAATVTFMQQEGAPTTIGSTGWFDGIRPGSYYLVIHEGSDCGPNAAKAGKPMTGAEVAFAVAKGASSLDVSPVASIHLDGEATIVGHALALHEDKKGKPGRVLACGPISAESQ